MSLNEAGDRWFEVRYLQLPPVHTSWVEKDNPCRMEVFTPKPKFTFLEARDKWAMGYMFMIRFGSTLQDLHFHIRNNNRNGMGNWTLVLSYVRNKQGLNYKRVKRPYISILK